MLAAAPFRQSSSDQAPCHPPSQENFPCALRTKLKPSRTSWTRRALSSRRTSPRTRDSWPRMMLWAWSRPVVLSPPMSSLPPQIRDVSSSLRMTPTVTKCVSVHALHRRHSRRGPCRSQSACQGARCTAAGLPRIPRRRRRGRRRPSPRQGTVPPATQSCAKSVIRSQLTPVLTARRCPAEPAGRRDEASGRHLRAAQAQVQ